MQLHLINFKNIFFKQNPFHFVKSYFSTYIPDNIDSTHGNVKSLPTAGLSVFKINTHFIDLIHKLDKLPLSEVRKYNLDFPTLIECQFYKEYRLFSKNKDYLYLKFKNFHTFKKYYITLFTYKKIELSPEISRKIRKNCYKLANIALADLTLYKHIKSMESIILSKELKRGVLDSSLEVARTFIGVPIYSNTFTEYHIGTETLKELVFSQVTGYLKYLVTDFEDTLLTFEGFYNMLISFFKHNEVLITSLKIVYQENINQFGILASFFNIHKNSVDLSLNYIYFSLLKIEIENCILNGYKTSFRIEIDQKSSCAVVLASLSKN